MERTNGDKPVSRATRVWKRPERTADTDERGTGPVERLVRTDELPPSIETVTPKLYPDLRECAAAENVVFSDATPPTDTSDGPAEQTDETTDSDSQSSSDESSTTDDSSESTDSEEEETR
jgi:hypothetical protein